MKIIVCVDKSNGMLFGGRRQSQDSILREKILSVIGEQKLFLNEYSAKMFENKKQLVVSEDFLHEATENDFCFIENCEIAVENVTEVYLFNWNRDYPADKYFPIDLKENFKKVKTENFAGSSHKKITFEIYQRRS